MAYLIGLYLVGESWVTRTRRLGLAAKTRSAAWSGLVWSRIGQLARDLWDRRPRRSHDDESGPLLDDDELDTWLADITDPNLPRFKEQEPKDTPDTRPERSSDLAPGPREESTRGIAWADGPTRSLPIWELRAAQPTALVTRTGIPRDEIQTHYDNNGMRRSYLGPNYNLNHKPKHAAPDYDDVSGGEWCPSRTSPPTFAGSSRSTLRSR